MVHITNMPLNCTCISGTGSQLKQVRSLGERGKSHVLQWRKEGFSGLLKGGIFWSFECHRTAALSLELTIDLLLAKVRGDLHQEHGGGGERLTLGFAAPPNPAT